MCIALFGNKTDLTDDIKIKNEEAVNLSKEKDMLFFTMSAKDNKDKNVNTAFNKFIHKIYESHKNKQNILESDVIALRKSKIEKI